MFRKRVVLHSILAPEGIADTLRRSIDAEGVPQWMELWFIRVFRQSGSRPVCGVIESNKFRVKSGNGGPWGPNFYAKCEPDYSGTRIEGHFDLAPLFGLSLRFTVVVMLGLAVVGILLNALDLTAGTHFTKDPDVGLVLSTMFVPFGIGFYLLGKRLGSRRDETLVVFLQETLAATRVR